MARIINLDLGNIDEAIKQLQDYEKRLGERTVKLRERLAETIREDSQEGFNAAIADDLGDDGEFPADVTVTIQEEDETTTSVIANGTDAVFVEFGAGVHYNGPPGTSPHPKGQELGFTIGSYGYGLGRLNSWRFTAPNGMVFRSYGVPAQMPMYYASETARDRLTDIAGEVFGSD